MRIDFTLFNWVSGRRVLFTCLVLFTAIGVNAFEVDGIYYNITTATEDSGTYGAVEVTLGSYSGDVVIPSEVTNGDYTYTVTAIADYAFDCTSSLQTVTFPSTLKTIGDAAFDFSSLTTLDLSACTSLTTIGSCAFYGCTSLTTVTLPSSLTTIGEGAFYRCTSLTSITVAENNTTYCSVDGVLYNIEKTTLVACPGGKTGVTIPESVTTIGTGAFEFCEALQSVTLPEGVETIGTEAFYSCTALTTITLPKSVTSIGNYAFSDCTALTQLVCLATSIPSCTGSRTFTSVTGCTLYVLEGYKDSYTSGTGTNYLRTYFKDENSYTNTTKEITPITIGSVGVTAYSHVQTTESTYLPDFSNVLDLGDSQSVTAYTISEVSVATDTSGDLVGTATMSSFAGTLAEKEGLIIKNDNDGACTVYAVVNESTDAETVSEDDNNVEETTNYLKATSDETLTNAYVFGYFKEDATDLGFYYFNSIDVVAGKAYLDGAQIQSLLGEASGGSEVKSIVFVYDDGTDSETTGISEAQTSASTVQDGVYYNLSGIRVKTPTKGIYIKNGKKVMVK